ncbi:MAG TPA: hypothetical protein PLM66_01410 [Candidatus Latescibacteria bacterium]|nr:hypothetical protein [Candidatus Latescibacterota bacterium]
MLSTIPEESFDRASALAHPAVCAEKPDLKGFLPDELREFLARFGKEKYRTNQLLRWMHGKGVADFDQMTDLGKEFRSQLKAEARVECLAERHRAVSRDGQTTKLVLDLSDGRKIETVMMVDDGRRTVCVSSQAGCALGCRFCATGQMGFQRNLTVGEILDQIHHAARGSFRARARTERCCLIRTCATCHDARLDGMPVVAQMALKHIYDPGFYDLVQFNRLRRRADHAITQADVDPWEQRFLASNQGMPYQ